MIANAIARWASISPINEALFLSLDEMGMFEGENNEERHEQRNNQIEEAEHDECREHVCRIEARKSCQEDDFQYAKAAGRVREKGYGERGEEDAEHHDKAGITFDR